MLSISVLSIVGWLRTLDKHYIHSVTEIVICFMFSPRVHVLFVYTFDKSVWGKNDIRLLGELELLMAI